jgi:hypothetical protein
MLSLLALSAAWAAPCANDNTALPAGPVAVGFADGDLGVARRLCPRTEVGISGGGLAVVETENFYGHIVTGGTLDGSWAASHKTEVFASIEAFRYDSVITPISASFMGFGHTALGATHQVWRDEKAILGVHGRLVLPTAVGLYRNAWPLAMDLGVGARWQPVRTLEVHGDIGALGSAAISAGSAGPRAGATVTAGVAWNPVKPFALVADVDAGFGYTAALDHLAAAVALRGALGQRVGIELGVTLPLAGRERALAAGELRVSTRLGPLPSDAPAPEPAG